MANTLGWKLDEIRQYTEEQLLEFWNADLAARMEILNELNRRRLINELDRQSKNPRSEED